MVEKTNATVEKIIPIQFSLNYHSKTNMFADIQNPLHNKNFTSGLLSS